MARWICSDNISLNVYLTSGWKLDGQQTEGSTRITLIRTYCAPITMTYRCKAPLVAATSLAMATAFLAIGTINVLGSLALKASASLTRTFSKTNPDFLLNLRPIKDLDQAIKSVADKPFEVFYKLNLDCYESCCPLIQEAKTLKKSEESISSKF